MPGGAGELSIRTRPHARNRWILVPVTVRDIRVDMVLDTGSPLSAISEATQILLQSEGLLEGAGPRGYMLRSVSIDGQPVPDLPVRISRRATQVGAEGVLGLDFLQRFTDIHFHVPTLRLTLVDP